MCARLLYSVASRHCRGFFHPESLESAAGFWGEGKTLKNAFVVSWIFMWVDGELWDTSSVVDFYDLLSRHMALKVL